MSINFSQIPANYPVPGVYTEISDVRAPGQLSGMPLKVIIIGQTGQAGSAGQRFENIQPDQAEQIYGAGTSMALAVRAFLAEQPMLAVDAFAVPSVQNAAPATGRIAFSGTASAAGTGALVLGGYRVSFPYKAGDDGKAVAEAALTAAQAGKLLNAAGLIVTSGSDGTSLTITSVEKGAIANSIDIRASSALADQIAGITVTVTDMNGGTGTPDLTDAITALGDIWYTDVVLLQNDAAAISAMVREAHRRADAMVAKDMRVFVAVRATTGQALALSGQFSTCEELILLALQRPRSSPWTLAASLAAQVAQSLNADPALQLRTLPLNSMAGLGPEAEDQFIAEERAILLKGGVSTVKIAHDGTMVLERIITTRTEDPASGVAVGVWDATVPAVKARVRYEFDTYIAQTYGRFKLADDGSLLSATDSVVTPKILKASWVSQCLIYQNRMGWIDDVSTMTAQSVFQRNATDPNRVDSCLPIRIIGNLIVLANSMKFSR